MAEGEAWSLLERLLEEGFGLPELPAVARTAQGKPWFPARPELYFNLSHSAGLALCGAGNCPLGVDVERVRPRRRGLADYVFSPRELTWFTRRGGDWGSFCTLWTLKEARVKCTGTGLRQAPRTIAVPLLEPGESGMLDGLTFRAYAGERWRAAACALGDVALPETIRMVR